jgi:hypothetical protein
MALKRNRLTRAAVTRDDRSLVRFPTRRRRLCGLRRRRGRFGGTVRYGQVIRRIVPDLFGEIFRWWYLVCYRQLLQTKWVAAKRY